MSNIQDAKRSLASNLRFEEGFVGIGLYKSNGKEGLRVYVSDGGLPVANKIRGMPSFKGFPVFLEITNPIKMHCP